MKPRYLSVEQRHQRELFESRIRVQPRVEIAIMRVTIAGAVKRVPRLAGPRESLRERHVTAPPVFVPAGGSAETVPATLTRITSDAVSPTRSEYSFNANSSVGLSSTVKRWVRTYSAGDFGRPRFLICSVVSALSVMPSDYTI